jgi:type II secretory pathway pseudopilin PulG
LLSRRAATVIELLAALTLAALLFATATNSLLRQQRTAARIASHVIAEQQFRGLTDLAAADLASLTPAAEDLVPGEARDTAIQFRAPVATGFACRGSTGNTMLFASAGDGGVEAGIASPPGAGDSLWWYPGRGAPWTARRIIDAQIVAASCPELGSGVAPALRVRFGGTDTLAHGTPLRVTRQLRYVLYHAAGGSLQLGLREWSERARRFAPPQPVAGPFLPRLATGQRTGFRYFDAEDRELLPASSGAGVDVRRVARVRLTALRSGQPPAPAADPGRGDSVDVALQRGASGP